jgi:hypothetical protein
MALVDLSGPVIAPGEALSSPLDCRGGSVLRVSVPANWTGACLSFQIGSTADGPWSDLFDHAAERIVYVRAGTTVLPNIQPPDAKASFPYVRFRSGPRGRPLPHTGAEPCIFVTTLDDSGEIVPPEPPPSGPPTVVDTPAVTVNGSIATTCAVGDTLACTLGNWTGEPSGYWQSWLADSELVSSGGGETTYTVQPTDAGKSIVVSVTASNASGSGNVLTNPVAVAA